MSLRWFLVAGPSVTGLSDIAHADRTHIQTIGFNRHIRPILSDVCSKCHGPDEGQREADLRLDTEAGLFADRDDHNIVVPKKPEKSGLFRRITSDDPSERMPPADSGRTLSEDQIALIRQWIEQGAKWEGHWSFIPPKRPTLPRVSDPSWCQTPIDRFILARLDQGGLRPMPAADRVTWLRRVTLDLIGLPPTPDEVSAFAADKSPGAYERVVDRLLQSPHFGERMAIRWLDLARYADTSGYQSDGPRYMWRWRDWVIDAYNAGMPFDQFTRLQLAGDLTIPPITKLGHRQSSVGMRGEQVIREQSYIDRLIPTAFNRNHRGNAEGGIIPAEYQVEYVVDRVETTATAWLGLTVGCGRCHDHKYDPVTQEEYYQLFAYFNNVPEYGRALKEGNSPPFIKAPLEEQLERLNLLDKKLWSLKSKCNDSLPRIFTDLEKWAHDVEESKHLDWTVTDGLIAQYPFDGDLKNKVGDAKEEKSEGGEPHFVVGQINQGIEFSGGKFVNAGDVADLGYFDKFSITAWVRANSDGTIVSRMTPEPQGAGYYVHLENGVIQVNLTKRWLDDSIRVETKQKLPSDVWQHIAVTYDGSRMAEGIKVYVDAVPQETKVNHDFLNQSFASEEPLRIGTGHSDFSGQIDDVRIYDRPLSPRDVRIVSAHRSINEILAIPVKERTASEKAKLLDFYIKHRAQARFAADFAEVDKLQRRRDALIESMPTLMIMQDTAPRKTHVLQRGQYDKPTEPVEVGVPAILPPVASDAPKNRIGLANWLVDPSNPLTARVTVNRYWQMFFGDGLVSTMEDFGVQGARPTHPDLLDWMATEFIRTGWDVKAMHKLIVMSAVYRQSSRANKSLLDQDPKNELLARGPRLRLPAELIRDQALSAAGLLTERLGGPSVKIYQPEGLWKEIATDQKYDVAQGADVYRRSLYAYWKRTVSPPSMATFDAPSREACVARRPLTNTPLQALSLLNDVTYLEAARVLAERLVKEVDAQPSERIRLAYRYVLARDPSSAEMAILMNGLEFNFDRYLDNPKLARKLVAVGQSKTDESLDPCEVAAYMTMASIILNLDETVTKE